MIEDVSLVEFMYLVFTRMPGESYQFFVVVLVLRISSANYLSCVLVPVTDLTNYYGLSEMVV